MDRKNVLTAPLAFFWAFRSSFRFALLSVMSDSLDSNISSTSMGPWAVLLPLPSSSSRLLSSSSRCLLSASSRSCSSRFFRSISAMSFCILSAWICASLASRNDAGLSLKKTLLFP